MQYVFLIRSRPGCLKYVTRLRLVTYFLPPALERIKNTYCMGQRPFLYLAFMPLRGQTAWYAEALGLSSPCPFGRHRPSELDILMSMHISTNGLHSRGSKLTGGQTRASYDHYASPSFPFPSPSSRSPPLSSVPILSLPRSPLPLPCRSPRA